MKKVDLLLITWNRKEYVMKTLDNLLSSKSNFNLFCWDNGSSDGTAEYISSITDKRIKKVHLNKMNVKQAEPTRWFLNHSTSEIIGKIDDDTLVPPDWIEKIYPVVIANKTAGMIGCWTFWPEDFERNKINAIKKIIQINEVKILHNFWIGGTAFLMRKELANKYLIQGDGNSFPIDRANMSLDGYLSGWFYPLIHADHMDDPRSEHFMIGERGEPLALTAKVRGLKTEDSFLSWIKDDADSILSKEYLQQVRKFKSEKSFVKRLQSFIKKLLSKFLKRFY